MSTQVGGVTESPIVAGAGFQRREPTGWHAAVRPNGLACIMPATDQRLTYRELHARIRACAANLTARFGRLAGQRVATLCRNGIELVVLALACERLGAVFVPLNWRLGHAELAAMLADCAPRLLVYESEFAVPADLPGMAALPRTEGALFADSGLPPPPAAPADPATPCLLLYTSGATGRPKGVVVNRQGAFHIALNFAYAAELGPGCVVYSDAPMSSVLGLLASVRSALTVGGTTVISDRFQPDRTLRTLSEPGLGITHYFAAPQAAQALRGHPVYPTADLSRLRAMLVGGAPLSDVLIEDFLADGVALVNVYGLTEVGIALQMPIDRAALAARPGAIGLPAPLLEARIARLDGTEAAVDEVGELWLRGPSVAPGYWNDPQATAAALRDGWFRTGDVVRRDADGFFWHVDRLQHRFICGGESVFPAELEAVLWAVPGLADVAVVGLPHPDLGESGEAFVVPRPDAALTAADVLGFCETRLAGRKRPTAVHFIDTIPRTLTGKVQKHLLYRPPPA